MNKCKRNIFLIFGYLLVVVILFIPYTSKYYDYNYIGGKKVIVGVKERHGYTFLPMFFIYKNSKGYIINLEILNTELAIVILFGGFAYILFCVVLRKSEKKGEK